MLFAFQIRSLFWIKKVIGNQTYWYSELFGRMSLDVPAQACGGFLAEEMVRDTTCYDQEYFECG
jgi:hypothetical protein